MFGLRSRTNVCYDGAIEAADSVTPPEEDGRMVALLISDPVYRRPAPRADLIEAPTPVRPRDQRLHVVSSDGAQVCPGADPRTGLRSRAEVAAVVVAAVVVAALVISVARPLQGSPTGASWAAVQQAARTEVPPVGPGDAVLTVQPGDTLWAMAGEIAPHLDRRQVVQVLADRNGGSSIRAGQRLIVPAPLANP